VAAARERRYVCGCWGVRPSADAQICKANCRAGRSLTCPSRGTLFKTQSHGTRGLSHHATLVA